ncbi:HAD family phosphatase [Actinacidiphila sp. DG2A-62]|uniref:HAD family hydrolase n=1 Tax=Actinacidiphila sp. DG2A-62 TaxID=3108821 RepID=UPI002DBE7482|nr:HAD family phosphatase [Actinacidiphila sp. DG2A-62]MEC3997936.1 HAD family phosphatase [Actinacidiphila sp. DG2A-62]
MTAERPAAPELVIFDCDGVLVDSERIAVHIDARVLAELGWPMPLEEVVERFVGRSAADMTAAIEQHLGKPLPAGWRERYRELYREAFERELAPVDGVVDALDALDARGLATCVASNSSHAGLRHSLGLTGLHERFRGRIFSAADVSRGKPAPDLFLHAARVSGVAPGRCVVVEDSRYGVRAACAAGMRVYGYAGGLTPAGWLAEEGAVVFDDMRDLPALIA